MNGPSFCEQRISEEVHDALTDVLCHSADFASPEKAIAYVIKRASARAFHRQTKRLELLDEELNDIFRASGDHVMEVDLKDEIKIFEKTIAQVERLVFRRLLFEAAPREELRHNLGLSLRTLQRRIQQLRTAFIRFRCLETTAQVREPKPDLSKAELS